MKDFAIQNPWMTFILGLAVLGTIKHLVDSKVATPEPLIPMLQKRFGA